MYTARQLINESWYISGIVSRGLETVSGEQVEDGLSRLNAILQMKAADTGIIPFFEEYIFNAVIGQETYFIPNLVEIESLTFNIGPVRYSMLETPRVLYFGTGRVDNVITLPYQWHMERLTDGSNVYMYPIPQDTYLMKLWGKFSLISVALNQDLDVAFEPFFIEYLKYELAIYLCEFYNIVPPPTVIQRCRSYEQLCRDVSPVDLTIQKQTQFASKLSYNYGDANLGRGWTRPSR